MDQVMTAHESIMVRALNFHLHHLHLHIDIWHVYSTLLDSFYPRTVSSMKIWLEYIHLIELERSYAV